jgi:hypothetical protein
MARGEIKSYVSPSTNVFFLVTVFNEWENYDIYSTCIHIFPLRILTTLFCFF